MGEGVARSAVSTTRTLGKRPDPWDLRTDIGRDSVDRSATRPTPRTLRRISRPQWPISPQSGASLMVALVLGKHGDPVFSVTALASFAGHQVDRERLRRSAIAGTFRDGKRHSA